MKTKLLAVLMVLMSVSMSINAQTDITGTYVGEVFVSALGEESTVPDINVFLSKETGGNTYAFSLKDFSMSGIDVGDLNISGVSAIENGGLVTLSKSGYSEGPTVNYSGININTRIYFNGATVENNHLSLNLVVKGVVPFLGEVEVASVTFTGEKEGDEPPVIITDITGTYVGEVFVSAMGEESTVPGVNVFLTKETGGNTYAFSLKDFSFSGIDVGDLNILGVSAIENEGLVTLSKSGYSEGPTVNYSGFDINTRIYFNGATVENNHLSLNLVVKGVVPFIGEVEVATVIFTGEKEGDEPPVIITDITGTYVGEVFISAMGEDSTVPGVNVFLTKEAVGNSYAFSLKDFSFSGIDVGDLNILGVSAIENEGLVTLSKSGYSEGPTVNILGMDVNTRIYLTEATVENNHLYFTLSVKGLLGPQEIEVASVVFNGNIQGVGIVLPEIKKNERLIVYPTLASDVINVPGLNGRYIIYSQNGSVLQSGYAGKEELNVSTLPSGIYFISVEGKSAKFIKK